MVNRSAHHQRHGRRGVPLDALARPRLAVPQHAEGAFDQRVLAAVRVGGRGVVVRPVLGSRKPAAFHHQPWTLAADFCAPLARCACASFSSPAALRNALPPQGLVTRMSSSAVADGRAMPAIHDQVEHVRRERQLLQIQSDRVTTTRPPYSPRAASRSRAGCTSSLVRKETLDCQLRRARQLARQLVRPLSQHEAVAALLPGLLKDRARRVLLVRAATVRSPRAGTAREPLAHARGSDLPGAKQRTVPSTVLTKSRPLAAASPRTRLPVSQDQSCAPVPASNALTVPSPPA